MEAQACVFIIDANRHVKTVEEPVFVVMVVDERNVKIVVAQQYALTKD